MHLSQIESLNKLNNKKNFYFKNEFIFSERFKMCSGIGLPIKIFETSFVK